MENTGGSLHDIVVEIDRYIVCPGQAISYKVGELKFKELKARAQSVLGSFFDIKELHTEFMKNGAVPMDILDSVINQYILQKEEALAKATTN
jgi:uncharacterized protein (DUF885 family)